MPEELTKILLNIRSLRAYSRELTLEKLEEALDKFTMVVLERQKSTLNNYINSLLMLFAYILSD